MRTAINDVPDRGIIHGYKRVTGHLFKTTYGIINVYTKYATYQFYVPPHNRTVVQNTVWIYDTRLDAAERMAEYDGKAILGWGMAKMLLEVYLERRWSEEL